MHGSKIRRISIRAMYSTLSICVKAGDLTLCFIIHPTTTVTVWVEHRLQPPSGTVDCQWRPSRRGTADLLGN